MPSLHGPFPIYRCHTRGCRCNRHRGRADRPQLRAPGGGAALMLADSVERRAAPGLGGTAAKAAVVSAARLKGLAVPLGLVAVWEIVARTGPEIGRASWRERVCQYCLISGVAVSLKNKNTLKDLI